MQIHILLELMILGCWDNTSSLCNSKKFEEEEAVKYGRSIKVLTRYAHWTVNVSKQNYVSIKVVTYFLPWWCHGHQNDFPWNLCCYKCFWLTNVERQTLAVSEFLKVKGQIGKRCIQPDLAFLQIAQAYLQIVIVILLLIWPHSQVRKNNGFWNSQQRRQLGCQVAIKKGFTGAYSGVLLKWELSAFLPLSLKKEEGWSEDCSK